MHLTIANHYALSPYRHGQCEAGRRGDVRREPAGCSRSLRRACLTELCLWCRGQLRDAEDRPQVMAVAEHVRAKRLMLADDTVELLARYQTTLDNQMIKLLRSLREAQEWRLKMLEPGPTSVAGDVEDVTAAA